ncbi:hypothetical protein AGLY_014870 [Aphis glycines]|uniref:PiggyBac transposable element-derived protein domain-containing protein n=1 Tax=Aphis glycines TaxID=307491 RepID=A0A6G0T2E5_APHGL|nr:hypothetical protein AGLY_014870 [Aphis glycines]
MKAIMVHIDLKTKLRVSNKKIKKKKIGKKIICKGTYHRPLHNPIIGYHKTKLVLSFLGYSIFCDFEAAKLTTYWLPNIARGKNVRALWRWALVLITMIKYQNFNPQNLQPLQQLIRFSRDINIFYLMNEVESERTLRNIGPRNECLPLCRHGSLLIHNTCSNNNITTHFDKEYCDTSLTIDCTQIYVKKCVPYVRIIERTLFTIIF